MANYAVLNFEDKIDGTGRGAADSTVDALKLRYEVKRKPKGLAKIFVKGHKVNEYRCVVADPLIAFTNDAKQLAALRAACSTATKVYLVLHGDPRTTDTAYTNRKEGEGLGVTALCNSNQLAAFLHSILPVNDKQTLALVMCYGARCKNFKSAVVNHQGLIDIDDLKTAFAYRLVYELHQLGHNPTVTAVTGKIQHDSTSGRALIEREELIDVNMDLAEASRTFSDQAKLHEGGGAAYKKTDIGKGQFERIRALQQQRSGIRDGFGTGVGDESNKYGKLVYRVKTNELTIVNKYGAEGEGSVGPGTVIYKGNVVTPGPA